MENSLETPGVVRLFVQNEVGLVAIAARQTDTTLVSLEPAGPGAEEIVERAVVEWRPTSRGHIVVVKIPKVHGRRLLRRNAVMVRVELPEGSDAEVFAGSADVEITGPIGTAEVTTASGDVFIDDVAADVTGKTASGHITLGSVGGDVRVYTASGDLRADVGRTRDLEVGAARKRVEVKATSGNVRLGALSHGARIMNVSGDVRILSVEEGTLHVRSVSGNVLVGVAKGVDLHVDVETLSGAVNSEIALAETPRPGNRRETRVDLSVRSVSGNVDIARALEQVA